MQNDIYGSYRSRLEKIRILFSKIFLFLTGVYFLIHVFLWTVVLSNIFLYKISWIVNWTGKIQYWMFMNRELYVPFLSFPLFVFFIFSKHQSIWNFFYKFMCVLLFFISFIYLYDYLSL